MIFFKSHAFLPTDSSEEPFLDLEKASGNKSKFLEHLSRSKLEFLKAVKCLVDDKIEDLEKKGATKGKKRATKIRVE